MLCEKETFVSSFIFTPLFVVICELKCKNSFKSKINCKVKHYCIFANLKLAETLKKRNSEK